MSTWLAIAGAGVISFCLRLGPLLVFRHRSWTAGGERLIGDAGTAAIAALIAAGTGHAARDGSATAALAAIAIGIALTLRGARMATTVAVGTLLYIVCAALAVAS